MTQLRKLGFPTTATLELTSRCNLSCDYCFIKQPSSELSTEQFISALDRLAEAGVLSLTLTGGEPFLRNDILTILQHIVKREFFSTIILSNGTLITAHHRDYIIKHTNYFTYLRFSFFSHVPAVHDAFTGVAGSFAKALATATALWQGGVRILVIINLTEQNIDTLPATKTFFRDCGFEVHVGSTKINASDYIKSTYAATTTKEFYRRYFSQIEPDGIRFMRQFFTETVKEDHFHDHLCENLFGMITVRSNGDLVPCGAFREHSMGNITTDNRPLLEIIRTAELYKELRSLRRSALQPCKECQFNRFCIICPGMMYSEQHSFDKPLQQTCNYAHAYFEAINE